MAKNNYNQKNKPQKEDDLSQKNERDRTIHKVH